MGMPYRQAPGWVCAWLRLAGERWPGVTYQGPCPGQERERPLGLRCGLALHSWAEPQEPWFAKQSNGVGRAHLQVRGGLRWAALCLSPAHWAGCLGYQRLPIPKSLSGGTSRQQAPCPANPWARWSLKEATRAGQPLGMDASPCRPLRELTGGTGRASGHTEARPTAHTTPSGQDEGSQEIPTLGDGLPRPATSWAHRTSMRTGMDLHTHIAGVLQGGPLVTSQHPRTPALPGPRTGCMSGTHNGLTWGRRLGGPTNGQ